MGWDVSENLVAVLYFPQYSKSSPSAGLSREQMQTLSTKHMPAKCPGTCWDALGHSSEVLHLHGCGNLHPGLLIRAGRDFSISASSVLIEKPLSPNITLFLLCFSFFSIHTLKNGG